MVVLPILGTDSSYALSPQKIIAIGLNYRDHVAESPSVLAAAARGAGRPPEEPPEPILFAKTPREKRVSRSPILVVATMVRP